jgi:hypothetical protein
MYIYTLGRLVWVLFTGMWALMQYMGGTTRSRLAAVQVLFRMSTNGR